MKDKNMIEIVNCHIASIVILINSIQFIFGVNFNIGFNMAIIEYMLLGLALIINKGKIKNLKNVCLLLVVILIFFINIVLDSNETIMGYFKGFMIMIAPILLIFTLNIRMEKFIKIFLYYNIFCVFMLVLSIFIQPAVISANYMTFGYFSIFSNSYVILYAYYYKKNKLFWLGVLLLPFTFIYGNRGTILIIAVAMLCVILLSNKYNKIMKILTTIIILLMCFWGVNILRGILDFVIENLEVNTYSINNIYRMLDSEDTEDLLGGRYNIYQQSIKEIKNNLITGMGIGKFENIYGYFPHNIFLEAYVTFGLIGGTIYFCMLLYLGIRMYQSSKECINTKILFIFCVSNITKLLISKSFIIDQTAWLYIIMAIYVLENSKKGSENRVEDNNIYTNL